MKLATVGSGIIVHRFLDAVKKVDQVQCVAVYSRSKENAAELAKKFDVKKTFTSYQQMLEDPEIDCVYIASPNSLHFSQSKQALLSDKHVICEKPLTSTMQELEELLRIAKEKNKIFLEAIMTVYLPNYEALKQQLHHIGQVKSVTSNFLQYSSKMDAFKRDENPNVFNPDFSGGTLMDLNVYNLHFVIGLFDKPQKASYHPVIERNIDVNGVVILNYPAFNAICSAAKNVQEDNSVRILGEKGKIIVKGEPSTVKEIEVISDGYNDVINLQAHENAMVYEVQHFADIINHQNVDEMNKRNQHSIKVYEILHQTRLDANLLFKADKDYNA